MASSVRLSCLWLTVLIFLNACSQAVEDTSPDTPTTDAPPNQYYVKVKVINLAGTGLVIQNNDNDQLVIADNVAYQFSTSLSNGDNFDISVLDSPKGPNQNCTPVPQSGLVNKSDIAVELSCITERYTVGGNVTGLNGSGLVVQLNGGNDLPIDGNTEFQFLNLPLDDNSDFLVSILSQPVNPSQFCQLANDAGKLNGKAESNVLIQCFDETTSVRRFPPVQAQRTPVDAPLTVRLSQPIDETTLNDTVVFLSSTNGITNGTVAYDSNTYTLKLTPVAALDFGMQYSVTVGNGLLDSNNNPINDSWSFSTTKSQFTKTIDSGATTTIDNNTFGVTSSLRQLSLYTTDVLSATSGYIHGMSFSYATDLTSDVSCSNATMKLGHSGVNSLNASFATNVNEGHGSQETVLNNADIVIPAGVTGDYFDIVFDQAFHYNGVDNLVVELQRGQCGGNVDVVFQNETVAKSLVATQSGLTGVLGQNLPKTKFLFTGGDSTINYPLAALNPAYEPLSINPYSWRVLALYPATDINGSGWVNGVAFKLGLDSTSAQSYTLAVKMAHSNRASLDSQVVDSNYAEAPSIVTDTVTIDIPASSKAGQYLWIPFANGFLYNGESNLIVELVVSSASGDTPFEIGTSGGTNNMHLRGQTSTTWAEGGNPDSFNIALRFADSSMDFIPGSFFQTADYPFNGTNSSRMQLLYDKTELGSSGQIQKLSFRLSQAANEEIYENVNVTLAHTGSSILSSIFADNMLDPISVFNGNVNVGGSLSTGDWIDIVLDTPFTYDARQNLLVQLSLDAGLNGANNLLVLDYSNQYNGRIIYATDRAATSSTAIFGSAKMAIKIGM